MWCVCRTFIVKALHSSMDKKIPQKANRYFLSKICCSNIYLFLQTWFNFNRYPFTQNGWVTGKKQCLSGNYLVITHNYPIIRTFLPTSKYPLSKVKRVKVVIYLSKLLSGCSFKSPHNFNLGFSGNLVGVFIYTSTCEPSCCFTIKSIYQFVYI